MAATALSETVMRETLAFMQDAGDCMAHAARAAGIPVETFRNRYLRARAWKEKTKPDLDYEPPQLPSEAPSAEELIARRTQDFNRKNRAEEARLLINIKVKINGPFGIVHMGDPHLDDDGTDLPLLTEHVRIIKETPGLMAGNVGDITNNWVGRLARLYGSQGTSAQEAWVLAEWLFAQIPWLYVVGGNHDVWSGPGDPLKWVAKFHGTMYEWHGARLNLICPNGREVRVNARHDFAGHSMWNVTHGPAKAVQMGWRDHILTCGHKHVAGYQMLKDPATGLVSHAIRVGTYKKWDNYAKAHGLPNQNIFPSAVTIIDPDRPDDDPTFVHVIPDVAEAASYLQYKRSRGSART